jgi:hypothetical protein
MAVAVIYFSALAVSIAFFLWCAGSFLVATFRDRRSLKQAHQVLNADSEPALFALYCQYLVAPQLALREARQMLASTVVASVLDDADFLRLLELLQEQAVPAPR